MSKKSEKMWNLVEGCVMTSKLDAGTKQEVLNFVREIEDRIRGRDDEV